MEAGEPLIMKLLNISTSTRFWSRSLATAGLVVALCGVAAAQQASHDRG